jgi:hypothetical protein
MHCPEIDDVEQHCGGTDAVTPRGRFLEIVNVEEESELRAVLKEALNSGGKLARHKIRELDITVRVGRPEEYPAIVVNLTE